MDFVVSATWHRMRMQLGWKNVKVTGKDEGEEDDDPQTALVSYFTGISQ